MHALTHTRSRPRSRRDKQTSIHTFRHTDNQTHLARTHTRTPNFKLRTVAAYRLSPFSPLPLCLPTAFSTNNLAPHSSQLPIQSTLFRPLATDITLTRADMYRPVPPQHRLRILVQRRHCPPGRALVLRVKRFGAKSEPPVGPYLRPSGTYVISMIARSTDMKPCDRFRVDAFGLSREPTDHRGRRQWPAGGTKPALIRFTLN